MSKVTTLHKLIDAATVTTTGEPLDVSMRNRMSVQIITEDFAGEDTVDLTIDVSNGENPDVATFVQYNRLIENVTNTNTEGNTCIAQLSISGNSSEILFLSSDDHFKYIRASVAISEGATGRATVILSAVD